MATGHPTLMCPHCGVLVITAELVPGHDYDRQRCPGSGQIPRCAESDGRRLWSGKPNAHYYRNRVRGG